MGRLPQDAELIGDKYTFADGYSVLKSVIDIETANSNMTELERSIMEKTTGKTYGELLAEQMHRDYLENKKRLEAEQKARQEQLEWERQSSINSAKAFLDSEHVHILQNGREIQTNPFTDDELLSLYNELHSGIIGALSGGRWSGKNVKPCFQYVNEEKHPGIIIFFDRDAFKGDIIG